MALFNKKSDLEAQLDASQTEITDLTATLAEREASIKTQAESITSLTEQLTAAQAETATAKEELGALTATHTATLAELEASKEAQEDFSAKVEAATLAKVASLGHVEPIEEEENTAPQNIAELKAEYAALKPGQERIDFRAKHANLFTK